MPLTVIAFCHSATVQNCLLINYYDWSRNDEMIRLCKETNEMMELCKKTDRMTKLCEETDAITRWCKKTDGMIG